MTATHAHRAAMALLAAAALAACSSARPGAPATAPEPTAPPPTAPPPTAPPPTGQGAVQSAAQGEAAAIARARADSARHPYTAADVHFMTVMIGHHAQAIQMARLAATHGASPSVRTLADRIINAQQDEIATMQQWLRERRQPVPEVHLSGDHVMVHGAAHAAAMPGMLTEAQLAQLGQARGKEFDRLFLTLMIQHHRGAVEMVEELFGSYGAGQDETVFKFASDVNVDQTTEIQRMEQMLLALVLGRPSP